MSALQRSFVEPEGVAPPAGKYSHAIRVRGGEMLFIAGQIATDVDGNLVGAGDAAAQTRQIFANIDNVLKGAGGSFADVVEFTYYLAGRAAVQPFLDARSEIFRRGFSRGKVSYGHPTDSRRTGARRSAPGDFRSGRAALKPGRNR